MISNNRSISSANTASISQPISFQTQQILSLGRRNGWGFTMLGKADLPGQSIHLEKWLIVPAHEDRTPVPMRTLDESEPSTPQDCDPKGLSLSMKRLAICLLPDKKPPRI